MDTNLTKTNISVNVQRPNFVLEITTRNEIPTFKLIANAENLKLQTHTKTKYKTKVIVTVTSYISIIEYKNQTYPKKMLIKM